MTATLLAFLFLWAQTGWKPADPAVACKDAKDVPLSTELLAMRDRGQIARYKQIADEKNEKRKAEVAAVELDETLDATTVDRILVREGKLQKYGTQFRAVNGVKVPELAMTPLAEHAAALGQAYGRRPVAASPVIAREWRGRVPTSRAAEYRTYLYEQGITKIRGISGNLGVQVLVRGEGNVTEFVVISYWPSRASIRAFAGDDIEKAHFLPRDREFLIHPDEHVRHYEVMVEEWAAKK